MLEKIVDTDPHSAWIKFLVKVKNLNLFLKSPRKLLNARWADILTDSNWKASDFAKNQFFRVYLRFSSKYRYHPQQSNLNMQRNIDPMNNLAARMVSGGTVEYYRTVCSTSKAYPPNNTADLSLHDECENIQQVENTVSQLAKLTSGDIANFITEVMMGGFSRDIQVNNDEDWELFREQIRKYSSDAKSRKGSIGVDVLPLALSYKNKEETFIKSINVFRKDEESYEDVETTEKFQRTPDFLDDRRWDQVKRTAKEYANKKNYTKISFWIDRLVMLGKSAEERKHIYDTATWNEFGMYPYMLLATIRTYDPSEIEFGTDFWRKVETTLAVSGKGLICDDYMVRKYDPYLYYDESVYERMGNGTMMIGGKSSYIRSTILSLAMMILTDGVAITRINEHPKTKESIVHWKSWAIRCITKDAFTFGPALPIENEPVELDMDSFKILTSWEYDLCHCKELSGGSYLDMSYHRSMLFGRANSWSGISEWIGMMNGAYTMDKENRENVLSYLNENTKVKMYAAPSGHTVARLILRKDDEEEMKSLVVETSRYSTQKQGNVIAVADATGYHGKPILPWYLKHIQDPDSDQQVEIVQGVVEYDDKWMKVQLSLIPLWIAYTLLFLLLVLIIIIFSFRFSSILAVLEILLVFLIFWIFFSPWPWADKDDVGEALFRNVRLHSLYGAGIKSVYRKLSTGEYRQIGWH